MIFDLFELIVGSSFSLTDFIPVFSHYFELVQETVEGELQLCTFAIKINYFLSQCIFLIFEIKAKVLLFELVSKINSVINSGIFIYRG